MTVASYCRLGRWMAGASGFLLLFTCLYACIATFAFDPAVYAQQPPFDRMAQETVAYLSDEADALSPELFGEQERLHMADVKALMELGRKLALGSVLAGMALLLPALLLIGDKKSGSNAFLLGLAAFAVMMGVLAAWAALDFSGWFAAMHRLAFSNDLWLFDASSPLIQMMPETFFISAVRTIGARFALCAGVLAAFSLATRRERPRGRSRLF